MITPSPKGDGFSGDGIFTMELWNHQRRAIEGVQSAIAEGWKRICLTSPTGGGKSLVVCELIKKWCEEGLKAAIYTNRKMLIDQLMSTMTKAGIDFGVRASMHNDQRWKPVQICSIQTEDSRVNKSQRWELHAADRVVIDELHINRNKTVQKIVDRHLEDHEASFVGVTATPIDLKHMCDKLIVAGTNSELRRCGALVPCYHFGPDEPDMFGIKRQKSGEYSENDVRKKIMTSTIFGRVWDHWKRLNPDAKPTILFAPGVAESIWFAEQMAAKGVRWAHIDGTDCWLDGQQYKTSKTAREDIIAGVKDGTIKGVSNRFVLREGVDIPEIEYGIFATVMGSLQTFLQSAGRILRAAASKTKTVLQDHGGMWHRFGSVNADRLWNLDHTENQIATEREERFRQKKEQEPIICPSCRMVRATGAVCPKCGFQATKKSRPVIQTDGTLKEYEGDIYKPRITKTKPDTFQLWKKVYWQMRNSGKTFSQAIGYFAHLHHYRPSRDLPYMPLHDIDLARKIKDVSFDRIVQPAKKKEPALFE